MKALILSAGLGTRLLPHTETVPKPLFPLNRQPVLGRTIDKLVRAGCDTVYINTHHLHRKTEAFVETIDHRDLVYTIHEPEILDTGGAVKNIAALAPADCLVVINSDVVFSLDIGKVVEYHSGCGAAATLVLHRDERFNTVTIDKDRNIRSFSGEPDPFAFTGIQVLSPEIYKYMPSANKFSSIELYENAIREGGSVKAYIPEPFYWEDIGTLDTYRRTAIRYLAQPVFDVQEKDLASVSVSKLAGDGSDRGWYRVVCRDASVIAADHGIDFSKTIRQADAFVRIGRHLTACGLRVPSILNHDPFSGMVIVQDLGDTLLEHVIRGCRNHDTILAHYRRVCESLLDFSIHGSEGFQAEWSFETPSYSKEMILDRECRYFIDSFVNGYLDYDVSFASLTAEFEFIADNAVASAFTGLMHRDLQSKNIMIRDGAPFFIDFQSARTGPVEYDLASLVIDPYVELPAALQERIVDHFFHSLHNRTGADKDRFLQCFTYCRITRNLQILGAFSHLSRVKNKPWFERYIPGAVRQLKKGIDVADTGRMPQLTKLIHNLKESICPPLPS